MLQPSLLGVLVLLAPVSVAAQSTVSIVPAADATIYGNSSSAGGGDSTLFTGATSGGFARRALLRFDLSSLPSGAVVSAVELDVTPTFSNANNQLHTLHRLLASWDEGPTFGGGMGGSPQAGDVTWFSRVHPGIPWATAGGEFAGIASASMPLANSGTQTFPSTPALVADVQAWIDQPQNNFGWILRGSESTPGSAYRIDSREAGPTAPLLRVTFSVAPIAGPFGVGCMGFALDAIGGLPQLGNAGFALELQNVPAAFSTGTVLISVTGSTVPVPFAGCPIWIDLATFLATAPVDPMGRLPLAIPNNPGLLGVSFCFQGVGIDAGTFGLLSTNGYCISIGS